MDFFLGFCSTFAEFSDVVFRKKPQTQVGHCRAYGNPMTPKTLEGYVLDGRSGGNGNFCRSKKQHKGLHPQFFLVRYSQNMPKQTSF